MSLLFLASLVWAFSFGLIKGQLVGLDPFFVAFVRMAISTVAFLPFLSLGNLSAKLCLSLMSIGVLQYGLMYATYTYAYNFLLAYQIAFFTAFTPFYVLLFDWPLSRSLSPRFFFAALLAVLGALLLSYRAGWTEAHLWGILLVQIANMSFALGQLSYRYLARIHNFSTSGVFALLYLGASLFCASSLFFAGGTFVPSISLEQACVLLYLGLIASGLCFFLWNHASVGVGSGLLAVANNLKIPLAVFVSVAIFREEASLFRLFFATALICTALALTGEVVDSRGGRRELSEQGEKSVEV